MRSAPDPSFAGWLMLAAILLVWTHSAHSTLLPVEDAVEAAAVDVSLPRQSFGLLSVRDCPGCPPRVFRVDDGTRYLVDRERVSQDDFLAAATEPAYRDGMIVVFFAVGSDRVTRLRLAPARHGRTP